MASRKSRKGFAANRLIPGYHGLREALRQKQSMIEEIWIARGKKSGRISEIIETATAQHIPVSYKHSSELTDLLSTKHHQGMIGLSRPFQFADFQAVKRQSLNQGTSALLLAADHITDAGNLGALIRTAAFFGAHGLVLPKDRCAGISAAVLKRASGTHLQLPVVKVTNLARALGELSRDGFWIIGAAAEAKTAIYDFDWKRPTVLVLGSEQKGLSPSVRKQCHERVGIPSPGGVESLNISVAGGVILSEIFRRRMA